MRNNMPARAIQTRFPGIEQRDDMIWLPLIGGDDAVIGLADVQSGTTTFITVAGAVTWIVGQYVSLTGVGGMTELIGAHKVIAKHSSTVWELDVDSTSFTAYTSGGTVRGNIIYDACENLPFAELNGTLTNIWDNSAYGLTSHSAGTYSDIIDTGLPDVLDFEQGSDIIAFSCSFYLGQSSSGLEAVFGMGRRTASGANTAAGCMTLAVNNRQGQFIFRPEVENDGDGSNTSGFSTNMDLTARQKVGFIVDKNTETLYSYLNGNIEDTDSLNLTNLQAWPRPVSAIGCAFGASFDAGLAADDLLGSSATPSQARVRDLMIWRPSGSLAQAHRAMRRWHKEQVLPE
jgi:hypothetical protein